MFNTLPFIAQSFKQSRSKDLRLACCLALSQIACRKSLSPEYIKAFTQQLLKSITSRDELEFDYDLKLKCLTTVVLFTQYQEVVFDSKAVKLLSEVAKVTKVLTQLSE